MLLRMSTSFPLVGVIVLNYNGRDCLLRSLTSLRQLRYPNFFVVIVDNGSQDDSLQLAKEAFPEFSYQENKKNIGFAAGMNVGLHEVFTVRQAAWAWLFNNDAVADENALTCLIEAAEKEQDAGLLSPVISFSGTKELWFGKGRIDSLRMRATHEAPIPNELEQESYPSDFLTGCALLIKKEVFEKVGPLDPCFFLYYEDADYSLRSRAAGFRTIVVPGARVMHEEQSQKNPQKLYHLVLSGLLFFHKHASFWQKPYFFLYGTIRRIKNVIDIMRGRDDALVVRRAYHDFYHGS